MSRLEDGCVVFIADIPSTDDTGWAWSPDRTRYNEARTHVLDTRLNLQSRIRAAVTTLTSHYHKIRQFAALGWCLDGHCILELARMQNSGMRAMATFRWVCWK
jgi:dienelactone hydrolase